MKYVNPHYTRQRGSPCPLMYQYYGTEYLGAGHGLTGILQMMLTVPGYLKHNPGAEADIRLRSIIHRHIQMNPCNM